MNESLVPVALVFAKSGAVSFVGKQTGTPVPPDGSGFRVKDGSRMSIQAFWTGTLTGTISIEASLNSTDGVNGNWTSLTVTLHGAQPAGSAGSLMVDPITVAAPWLRVRWTFVSGAGNITVYLCGKGS